MATLSPALEVWIALSFSWELDLLPSEVVCQGNLQFVSEREIIPSFDINYIIDCSSLVRIECSQLL